MSLDELSDALAGERKEREHYEPGTHHYDFNLVSTLVERSEYINLGTDNEMRDFIRKEVPAQMERVENFDSDAFLDALIHAWLQVPESSNLPFLLDESIKALYANGVESITLDMSPTEDLHWRLLSGMRATDERRFKAFVWGNVVQFARSVEYCDIRLDGCAQVFGEGARHSVLRYDGDPGYLNAAAADAEDSTFYLPTMDSMPFIRRRNSGSCGGGEPTTSMYQSCTRCEFYIAELDDTKVFSLRSNGFWRSKNRLYVPGEDGNWEEVLPDDR